MAIRTRTGNGIEFLLTMSPVEETAEGRVQAMEALLRAMAEERGWSGAPIALHGLLRSAFPSFGPLFGLIVPHNKLAHFLEHVASQPWRAPGAVQLLARDHGTQHGFRALQGIKQIVEARTRAASGLTPWWQVSGLATRVARARESGKIG